MIGDGYSVKIPGGTFTGSGDGTERIAAAAVTGQQQSMLTLILSCTGSGYYSVTVQQATPKTLSMPCEPEAHSFGSVPLDEPAGAQTVTVDVPDGSHYWLSAYYTAA